VCATSQGHWESIAPQTNSAAGSNGENRVWSKASTTLRLISWGSTSDGTQAPSITL
jgi:hypothetical protein